MFCDSLLVRATGSQLVRCSFVVGSWLVLGWFAVGSRVVCGRFMAWPLARFKTLACSSCLWQVRRVRLVVQARFCFARAFLAIRCWIAGGSCRFVADLRLVRSWLAFTVASWLAHPACSMFPKLAYKFRSASDSLLASSWFASGSLLVPACFVAGSRLVRGWFLGGSELVRGWLLAGFSFPLGCGCIWFVGLAACP